MPEPRIRPLSRRQAKPEVIEVWTAHPGNLALNSTLPHRPAPSEPSARGNEPTGGKVTLPESIKMAELAKDERSARGFGFEPLGAPELPFQFFELSVVPVPQPLDQAFMPDSADDSACSRPIPVPGE